MHEDDEDAFGHYFVIDEDKAQACLRDLVHSVGEARAVLEFVRTYVRPGVSADEDAVNRVEALMPAAGSQQEDGGHGKDADDDAVRRLEASMPAAGSQQEDGGHGKDADDDAVRRLEASMPAAGSQQEGGGHGKDADDDALNDADPRARVGSVRHRDAHGRKSSASVGSPSTSWKTTTRRRRCRKTCCGSWSATTSSLGSLRTRLSRCRRRSIWACATTTRNNACSGSTLSWT